MTFTKAKAGRLLQVGQGYAFCPNPLPPQGWTWPADLWPQLIEIRAGLAHLEGRLVHLDRPEFLRHAFATREASSSAELAAKTGDLHLPVTAPAALPAMLAAEASAALDAFSSAPNALDPLVVSFLVHYQAAAIHSFTSAGMRGARQRFSKTLLERCGLSVDWLTMSAFFAARADEYSARLVGVSTNGEWTAWLAFALDGAAAQCQEAVRLSDALVAARIDVRARLKNSPARLRGLADKLFEEPTISVREARDFSRVTYPTARADLRKLESLGIVSLLPGADEITYRLSVSALL